MTMMTDLLFFTFASILLLAACGVITAKNPMYCVLLLILCFFNAAALFLLLGAEFLALLLVMVYVGAVAVMFLFVLMTINIDFAVLKEGFAPYLPTGLLVAGVLLAELILAASGGLFGGNGAVVAALPMDAEVQNIVQIGNVLFTNYIFIFQLAAMILLVAMVGAIVLTHRVREGSKKQKIAEQLQHNKESGLILTQPKAGEGVSASYFSGKTHN